MKIAFNPSTVEALIAPPNNKDITFDLRGQNIFARGVKFCGTDTNTWRDIKINDVSIGSNTLDLRDGDNTTLTNINGIVTINSTWRPVVDNLTSDSTTSSLSANLGRVLKALIDGKSDSDHNHDDRYLRLTGGLMLGDITFGGDNKIIWGRNTDSASISFKNDGDGDSDSYMSFVTSDNGNEYFRWSHSSGSTNTEWMSLRSDGLRVGGTKVSLEGHSHNDLYYTKAEVNNKLNGKSDTSHTHDDRYLKLTGGTMAGIIRATNRGGTWISGRDHCLIRSDDKTSSSYWSAILAIATVNGYWTLGHLGDGGERIGFNYDTDADYNAGHNNSHVIWLPTGGAEGTLALTSDIPTSLKNPHALTISLNGTSQGPYDGSAAKNINITPSSIGAATSDHNHINYLSANGNISGNIDNIWTHGTYGFGNRSNYTGTLPGNSNYGGFLVLNPSATTIGTYYTTQIALLPGYFGYRIYDDHKWYDWKEVSMVGHNHDGRYVRYYAVTTLDCNNLAVGLTAAGVSATNAAHTNHSAFLYISDVGTPFQIQIPDSSVPYIYKRYYSSGTWSGWFKLNAGYADSAGSATKLETARNIFGLPFDGTNDIGGLSFLIDSNIDTDTSAIKWTAKIVGKYTSASTGGQGLLIGAATNRKYCRGGGIAAYATNVWGNNTNLAIYKSQSSDYDVKPVEVVTITENLNVGIGTTNPSSKLTVNGDIWCRGALRVGSSTTNNYIAFYGNTGDAPGSFATSFIGEHLWGGDESTELLLMKFNDVGNGIDGTTVSGSGPDRIRHIAHAHVFLIMTDTSLGDFATMAATTAVETKLDITRNRITASVPLYLQSDLHVNGTLGVNNTATFNINNQWLTPSVLQIGRLDASQNESKAVIGVTDGNLHIDAYHGKLLYLNFYNRGQIRLGYQTGSYYISEDGSYYNGTVAHASSAGNADMVDGYHISDESRQVYRNYYTVDNPAGAWILIKLPAWNANNEIVAIDGYGDNRQAHCVVHCGSRYQGIWGYLSDYNGTVVDRIRWKEVDSGKFAIVALINGGITTLTIKATNSLEISKTTEDNAAFAINSNFFSNGGVFHGNVDWDKIIGKPSSFTPSEHTHSWTSITDKIVAGNEFNIVNAGFNSDIYFNYLPINDRNSTAYINSYIFGNGHQGLALVLASGFVKNGSSDSYVLLGGGGHKLESSLNVASASVASKVYGQVGDTGSHELVRCDMNNDQFRIIAGSNGNNNGWAEIATADDGSEPIYVRQYTGVFSSVKRTLTLLDANGYTHFPSYINIGGNENNNSSPDRVWGSNGSDSYLRSYRTSALNVNYANSAGNADTVDGYHASSFLIDRGGNYTELLYDLQCKSIFSGNNLSDAPTTGWVSGIVLGSNWNSSHYQHYLVEAGSRWYATRSSSSGKMTNWNTFAYLTDIPNPTDYYWANVKISASSSTTTSPTVHTLTAIRVCAGHNPEIDNSISCSNWFRSSGATGWYNTTYKGGWYMSDTSWIRAHNGVGIYTSGQIYSSSSIRMSDILLEHTNEINSASGLHLNYRNSGDVTLCQGGGNVGIGTTSPSYKLDVNGLMRASGFHHSSMNSNNYILLAGGGYKSFGGNYDNPIFLGYLNLERGNDGTISSSFYCLGYSVSFTYTRGGNYCKISIPDTTYLSFYIRAAIASVNYSGGGMDTWVGDHRNAGAWWLHCYAYSSNEVRVKGFCLRNSNNDSWWGGNPLWSGNEGANRITVCIFGYVTFR